MSGHESKSYTTIRLLTGGQVEVGQSSQSPGLLWLETETEFHDSCALWLEREEAIELAALLTRAAAQMSGPGKERTP